MAAPRVTALAARNFRNYSDVRLTLDPSLTVVLGPNGAGKTNLLEALYFGATGRSPRTSNDRELLGRGADVLRVELDYTTSDGSHRSEVGFEPGLPKAIRLDGNPVASLTLVDDRPLMSVFLPDRLELIKGAPSRRRAHLDSFVAALWPARRETRSRYARALAQRNALLARHAAHQTLAAWEQELAEHGFALMADRREAAEKLEAPAARSAARLGLTESLELAYRPRSAATSVDQFAAELADRRSADLQRGFTTHGPHRDDLRFGLGGVALRTYGSQGQQRVGLLALLLAERGALRSERDMAPVLLLDDVMSELDVGRREALIALLLEDGQALLTATEAEHVPGASDGEMAVVEVAAGELATTEPVSR